jgi:Flp pilus assembly protein TadD
MTMNTQQSGTNELERATLAMKETRWADAITDLRTAHERAPDDCDLWGRLGFALSRNEQYAEAVKGKRLSNTPVRGVVSVLQ